MCVEETEFGAAFARPCLMYFNCSVLNIVLCYFRKREFWWQFMIYFMGLVLFASAALVFLVPYCFVKNATLCLVCSSRPSASATVFCIVDAVTK